jgi:hypothetical protein
MTKNHALVSARAETSRRIRRILAGALAFGAGLLPFGAFAMNGTQRLAVDQAGNVLPLPAVPHLDSMRWMSWKPIVPLFKVDTLLLPDSTKPGSLRIPTDHARDLPHMS